MKYSRLIFASAIMIILVCSSCVSRKKLTYLQFSERSDINTYSQGEPQMMVTPAAYKVLPYDNLFIRVVTPDPQWSALFNMDFGSGGLTQESASLSGYPVDSEGYIELPFVEKIKVEGKTLAEVKSELETVFKNYVTDAAITVRLVNNSISVIGEVSNPGRHPLTKDRITIFEALSMAGDLGVYSDRQRIQLIRPSPYGPVIKEFSLRDRSILSSEYYYVMPNDVIYAIPMKGRSFEFNSTVYSVMLSTISTALVILSFFRTL